MTLTSVEQSSLPTGDGTPPLLALQNVEVVYNEVSLALRGISLEVPAGGAVALLGANGAGKTTTIRAISGLLDLHDGRIRDGSVTLDGEDISRARANSIVARGIAQVPEGRKIFGHLTVEENLKVGASAGRTTHIRERLDEIYTLFPALAERRNGEAGWMSGGEQQMIAVGRALMASPRLLLLDEVSLGLAPQIVESIVEQLHRVREEKGTAMLMVEQNAAMALDFTEYGYILENGRVVLDGSSEKLAANEDVKEFYLGIAAGDERKSFAEAKHYQRRKRWAG